MNEIKTSGDLPQPKPEVFKDFSDMEEIEPSMSNMDNTIDDGMDEQLRAQPGKVYGKHAAWNFNACVWFENGMFHSEVWVHRAPRQTFSAGTLRELMDMANAEYGSE